MGRVDERKTGKGEHTTSPYRRMASLASGVLRSSSGVLALPPPRTSARGVDTRADWLRRRTSSALLELRSSTLRRPGSGEPDLQSPSLPESSRPLPSSPAPPAAPLAVVAAPPPPPDLPDDTAPNEPPPPAPPPREDSCRAPRNNPRSRSNASGVSELDRPCSRHATREPPPLELGRGCTKGQKGRNTSKREEGERGDRNKKEACARAE